MMVRSKALEAVYSHDPCPLRGRLMVLAMVVGGWVGPTVAQQPPAAPTATPRPTPTPFKPPTSLPTPAPTDVPVLNDQSPWRFFVTFRPVPGLVVKTSYEPGEIVSERAAARWVRWGEPCSTPLPPADWMGPEFDDATWPRRNLPIYGGYGGDPHAGLALLCLRAKFGVPNPDQARGLRLNLAYRGGVVVYLNGKEIARQHLPAGPLDPLAPAEAYPKEAFLQSDGQTVLPQHRGGAPDPRFAEQFNLRVRSLTVELPVAGLQRGTNVLAVEIHRAARPPEVAAAQCNWDTAGLVDVSLTARPSAVVKPNVGAPDGEHLWTADSLLRPGSDVSFGDRFDPPAVVRLQAPRNGVASGQAIITAPGPLGAFSAKPGELKSAAGDVIPPSLIQVRYADLSARWIPLLNKPPAGANIVPVWFTVQVPPDAKPGVYTGKAMLFGLKRTAVIPLELTVYGWKVGQPRDWRTSVNVLQSPESVAGHYRVPRWSDEHFALLEKSLAFMAQAGNDVLGVGAVGKSVFGDDPLIVFREVNGQLQPEFKFLDRYLDAYNRLAGPPQFLAVNVWSYGFYYRGFGRDGGKEEKSAPTIPIQVLQGDQLVPAETPMYGLPGSEELWKQVMDGIHERVQKLGWKNTRILLGTSGDTWPSATTVNLFKKIAPYAQWRGITHGNGVPKWGWTDEERTQPNGMVVAYMERVREITLFEMPVPGYPTACNARDSVGDNPFQLRCYPGLNVTSRGYDGICWKGLDYWPFPGPEGKPRSVLNHYVTYGNCVGSTPRTMLAPGPDGAVSTVQFEALREGLQESEAVLYMKGVLLDPALKAKLPGDLAQRMQTLIDDLAAIWETGMQIGPSGGLDYRAVSHRLLTTVTEVYTAVGGVEPVYPPATQPVGGPAN